MILNNYARSCIGAIHNRSPESRNRHLAYEENINYGEKDVEVINLVELPSAEQFENINYSENNVEVINLVKLPSLKQFVNPTTICSNNCTNGRTFTTSSTIGATHLNHNGRKEQ